MPATAVVSLVVVVALLLGATVGTVSAAQASLPGSWLHPLKLRLEDLRLARAGDPKTAVQRAMAITRARVEEVQRLVEAGRSVPPEVARRYQEHLTLAFGMAESLPAASRAATLTQIEAEVTTQLTSVEEAAEQGPDEDVAAARQMVEAMRQALGRDPEDGELGGEAQPTMTPTPQPETPTRTPDTGTGRVTATPTQDPTGTSVRPMPTPTSSPGSEGNAIQVTPTATTEGGSWEARPTPTPKPTTGDGGPQVTAPQATPPRVTRPRATAPPTPAGVNWQPSPASTPKPGTRDGVP